MCGCKNSCYCKDSRIDWFITTCNREYDLRELGISVIDYDGIDVPKAKMYTDKPVLQHGEVYLGFKYKPRKFSLKLLIAEAGDTDYRLKRKQIIDIFKHTTTPLTVTVIFENGDSYAIDCVLDGSIFSGRNRVKGSSNTMLDVAGIPLKAYNPAWRSVAPVTGEYRPATLDAGFDYETIRYAGSLPVGGAWRIHGPYVDPVLTNHDTGYEIAFTNNGGLSIAQGEWIDIDLGIGKNAVRHSDGRYLDGYLSTETRLSKFVLLDSGRTICRPDGALFCSDGTNRIGISGSGTNVFSRFEYSFYTQEVGI